LRHPQRELRELVRYRRSLIEEQSREANRVQKVLQGANIKLGDVSDPEKLADLARGRLKKKREQLAEAL
jgi:transposase